MFSSNTDSASDAFHVVRWRQVTNCQSIAVHEDNVKKKSATASQSNRTYLRWEPTFVCCTDFRLGSAGNTPREMLCSARVLSLWRCGKFLPLLSSPLPFFLQQRTHIDRPSTHREVGTAATPAMLLSNRFRRYARMNILPASWYSFDCR